MTSVQNLIIKLKKMPPYDVMTYFGNGEFSDFYDTHENDTQDAKVLEYLNETTWEIDMNYSSDAISLNELEREVKEMLNKADLMIKELR